MYWHAGCEVGKNKRRLSARVEALLQTKKDQVVLSSSGYMNRDWSWNIKQSRGIHISAREIKEFVHIIREIKTDQNRPDKTEEKQMCVGGWVSGGGGRSGYDRMSWKCIVWSTLHNGRTILSITWLDVICGCNETMRQLNLLSAVSPYKPGLWIYVYTYINLLVDARKMNHRHFLCWNIWWSQFIS